MEDALELRITAFEAEADQLAATENELVALIAERASQPEEQPPSTTTTSPPDTTTTTDAVRAGAHHADHRAGPHDIDPDDVPAAPTRRACRSPGRRPVP